MALQITIAGSIHKSDDILVVLGKKSKVSHFAFLSPYKTVLKEKIEADKTDFLTFFEGSRKINVAIYSNNEKELSYRLENVRSFSSKICKLLNKDKYASIQVTGLRDLLSKAEVIAFLEGIELTNYNFNKYKNKRKEEFSLKGISIEKGILTDKDITEFTNIARAVEVTKNMVNEPVIHLTAEEFSNEMVRQGAACGFEVEVLNKTQIEALNMGGLIGVNKGSIDPPTFNILTYKPANAVNRKPLVLVGKGVVFDTGGYSLKISGSMLTMKCDMAGGAAVLGSLMAVSLNKLPLYVVGLIPATDNKISSNAIVLDDVLTMHNGMTVEVQNTDAEGRLILADALSFAAKYKPELVIDLATLTGAAAAITGPYGSAIMGTDQEWRETLKESGEETFERLAEIPYWREFSDLLKSDVADLRNMGGPTGGATTAGKFLEYFTSYNWLHLDIAGTAFLREAKDYRHKGATGVGVRLLYNFAKRMVKKSKK
jgi:leucyl aminopeptidase